jgi:hypothetical protein
MRLRYRYSGRPSIITSRNLPPLWRIFSGRLILRRVIPAPGRIPARELQDRHATGDRSIALEQCVALAAREIVRAILGKNVARQLGIFLLD